jgi:superfamily II DNA or RNA helicase
MARYSGIYIEDSSLRPYQLKAKKDIFESWDEVDSVMFQMPTGTGKTRLFSSIISDISKFNEQHDKSGKILIIAHRTELIDQIDENLSKYKVPHNIIAGGRKKDYTLPVIIASIYTIIHPCNVDVAEELDVQFVIIDEAHHSLSDSYQKLWGMYPKAKKLGVTATPWRMDHRSFESLFDKLIVSMPVKDFIKQGYLSPYKYYSIKNNSFIQRVIDSIEVNSSGEYNELSMEKKMDIGYIRAQLLDSYQAHAKGKKGIIYAINIEHAQHICEKYKEAGYNAVSIDSNTKAAERKELIDRFRKGEINIIVNVDIFSEGFDCPDIEFIQLARPTRSLVKYLQQVGRGLRPTENKERCIILDNVGVYSRFGLPDVKRLWEHHFRGHKVMVKTPKLSSSLNGRYYGVNITEGTEDMELIQDTYEEVEYIAEAQVEKGTKQQEKFNPMPMLEAHNYIDENYVFWFKKSKKIYESYIQDDQYFIISELVIDDDNNCVHRKRVGKIKSDSWVFSQLLHEGIFNIRAITHFGGQLTIFHFWERLSDNIVVDKYFDYKGKEIVNPDSIREEYEKAQANGGKSDIIDLPVSKASYYIDIDNEVFTIYRTFKKSVKQMAKITRTSDFAQDYYQELANENKVRMSKRMPQLLAHNTNWFYVIRSDEDSSTVYLPREDYGLLIQYDFNGKLLSREIVSDAAIGLFSVISTSDLKNLKKTLSRKNNSYKHFWFLAFLQIYIETQEDNIPFRKIYIRMVYIAWRYVFGMNGSFQREDELPNLIKTIKPLINPDKKEKGKDVEEKIYRLPETSPVFSELEKLFNNIPFGFLSPWIRFTSKDDVKMLSHQQDIKCLYNIHDDYITINKYWKRFLINNYEDIVKFVIFDLLAYLRLFHIGNILMDFDEFYNTNFSSLSKLLNLTKKWIEKAEMISSFNMYRIPFTGNESPREIIEKIPASKCTIDSDGRKHVNVPDGSWSLKKLEELLYS